MRLIGTNISNLTDARFFAAYLPDLLVISAVRDLEELKDRLAWLREVRPWIEGPAWGLTVLKKLSAKESQILHDTGISTIVHRCLPGDFSPISGFENFLSLSHSNSEVEIDGIASKGLDALIITDLEKAIPHDPIFQLGIPVFLEVYNSSHWSKLSSLTNNISGVALRGGDEEKVGLKSYDHLDLVLETIFN